MHKRLLQKGRVKTRMMSKNSVKGTVIHVHQKKGCLGCRMKKTEQSLNRLFTTKSKR
jgi:hypothetical protein